MYQCWVFSSPQYALFRHNTFTSQPILELKLKTIRKLNKFDTNSVANVCVINNH